MAKHALLSASSANRWLHCPPSARLGEEYEDVASEFAAEGTDAHSLCEYKLKRAIGQQTEDPVENLTWYNEEMEECASGYTEYVMELLSTAEQHTDAPIILVEQRVDFGRWVREGFGTADCIIIADGTLNIVDFKYGKGVEVSAEENPQMKLYALGALELFDAIYDIDTVTMTIYQPRLNNVSVFSIPKTRLYEWAEKELRPAAELAFQGEGDYRCGDWCRFCKAKAECRERAEANMSLAQYEFRKSPILSDTEIEEILGKLDDLTAWANDIRDYALQAAISGKKWSGWKLVEGRSIRKYKDESMAAAAVKAEGFDPYEQKLLSVTEMQKMLGKNRFDRILGELVEKPQGKPTLVTVNDKRPEMVSAMNDFKEEN